MLYFLIQPSLLLQILSFQHVFNINNLLRYFTCFYNKYSNTGIQFICRTYFSQDQTHFMCLTASRMWPMVAIIGKHGLRYTGGPLNLSALLIISSHWDHLSIDYLEYWSKTEHTLLINIIYFFIWVLTNLNV